MKTQRKLSLKKLNGWRFSDVTHTLVSSWRQNFTPKFYLHSCKSLASFIWAELETKANKQTNKQTKQKQRVCHTMEEEEEEKGRSLEEAFCSICLYFLQNLCLSIRSRSFTPHQFMCQSVCLQVVLCYCCCIPPLGFQWSCKSFMMMVLKDLSNTHLLYEFIYFFANF